jgi:cytochrome c oxidase subunit III
VTAVPLAVPAPDRVRPTTKRGYSTAWWGMVSLITTESMVFVCLLGSFFFLRASSPHWPLGGIPPPELRLSVPFSVVLWASSVPIFYADAAIKRGSQSGLRAGLLLSSLMGVGFLLFTAKDFNDLHFGWRTNAYGSIYYTTVGLHALHVIIGLGMSVIVQIKAWQGKFSAHRHTSVEVFSLYWHFVDAVWVFVFSAFFLSGLR